MSSINRDRWDNVVVVLKESGVESAFDGRIKNLIYNTDTMEWEAQTSANGGSGGSGGAVVISALTSSVETRDYSQKKMIDEISDNLIYIGESANGSDASDAAWRIKRISTSGTVTTIEWADGNGLFDNIWNDRASLTYL